VGPTTIHIVREKVVGYSLPPTLCNKGFNSKKKRITLFYAQEYDTDGKEGSEREGLTTQSNRDTYKGIQGIDRTVNNLQGETTQLQ